MKQRFIIEINEPKDLFPKYNFFRVGCRSKKETIECLKGWINKAIEEDAQWLYKCFFVEGAKYKIISTPDGVNEKEVVLSGFCADLID